MNNEDDIQRITNVSSVLYKASQSIRILSHIDWPSSVREQFFAKQCKEFPKVNYPVYDPSQTLSLVGEARHMLKETDVDLWLARIATKIEYSACMLSATGTQKFYDFSEKLYGKPTNPFVGGKTTPLELAQTFDKQISSFSHFDMGAPLPMCYLASDIATQMQAAVKELFGEDAPKIEIVDEL
jgi:hypothetical protein